MPDIFESYQGVGQVHARLYGTTGAFRRIGNVSELALKAELDVQQQRDYTRMGGGTLKENRRIKSVQAAMTWLSFNSENFALAVGGTVTAEVAGTNVVETVKAYKGSVARLGHLPSNIDTVTNMAGTTTYAAGTDYEMSPAGLFIPSTSTIIDASDVKVTYDHDAYDRIEAATRPATVLEVMFEGLNEVESGRAFVVDIWRLSIPPAEQIALINEQMADMKFAAELLKDPTKGASVSAFWRARKATA